MCGIAGFLRREPGRMDELECAARSMRAAMTHRGPDMSGMWAHPAGLGALAFARLSIQDLSPDANQPMHSESGRYALVFNGEVYNCDELRALIGRPANSFRTHSDTEVLLACIDKLGLEATLKRVNAMLALALWDRETGSVFLARDRIGKKPLHYAVTPDEVCFASEIKALLQRPTPRDLCPEALDAYFALTYIPAPLTVWRAVRKVRPGHILEIRPDLSLRERAYWSCAEVLEGVAGNRRAASDSQEQATALIKDAARRRLISDVPVGVLMSGGLDSTLVAHTVARGLGVPLQTFTIGVEDRNIDETRGAQAIAAKLGVEHTALTLSRADAAELVDDVTSFLDEPFGDYSAIPTYAVCRLAKPHATVLLSGDGGDEVFGGYNRYRWSKGPRALVGQVYARWRRGDWRMSAREVALEIYRRLMTWGRDRGSLEADRLERWSGGLSHLPRLTNLQYLRYIDFQLYLPDDILAKTDRMSMACSVELRSPLLDYRLIEFSWGLPDAALVSGGTRKVLMRRMFADAVGPELLQSRKHGFGLPVGAWLAGPLREQVETAVEETCKRDDIPVDAPTIRKWWTALKSDGSTAAHSTWLIYAMWQWSQRWERKGACAAV